VDTGSYGLRLLAPVLLPAMVLPLQVDTMGNALVECTPFAGGNFIWGPVVRANMKIAGETALDMPIQLIGDSRVTAPIPSDCSGTGTEQNTVQQFGANGIIGIGPFQYDCPGCSVSAIPGAYYGCSATACTSVALQLSEQVVNPVTLFATDNNGEMIQLPSVANAGELTVAGTLTFGIDTQSNNVSGMQSVLNVDDNAELTITYNLVALPSSFIDSGSNGNYFNTNFTLCAGNLSEFYCPPNNILNLATTIQGVDPTGNPIVGQSTGASFGVGSAQVMLNTANSALPLIAGTNPVPQSFDFGLPFFYGKRVAVAVEGAKTTVGTGPYVAF
jgi:hypothetical protein